MVLIVLLGSLALIWAIRSASPARDESGALTEGGPMTVDTLRVGDCLNLPTGDEEFSAITARKCSQPHDAQVFAIGEVPAGDYPGEAAIQESVDRRCGTRFEEMFADLPNVDDLEITSFAPTQHGWPNRGFSCLVTKSDGTELIGDLAREASRHALRTANS